MITIKSKEGFKSVYKSNNKLIDSITINLNQTTITPYKIGVLDKFTLEYRFIHLLKKLMPMDSIIFKNNSSILDLTNKNFIQLGCITEDMLNFNNTTRFRNVSFVCGTNYSTFTLIVPFYSEINNWHNLKGKKVGTSSIGSLSYIHLKSLMKSYRFKENDMNIVTGNIYNILHKFINYEIDAVYYTIIHPNPIVFLYEKNSRIKLLDTSNIDKSLLNFYIPNTIIQPIDTKFYSNKIKSNQSTDSYGVRNIIIANNTVSNIYIFKLLYSLVINIFNLKSKRKYLSNLSLSLITYTRIDTPVHPGALLFFKKYNFITDIDNKLCDYFYSKTECTEDLLKQNSKIFNNVSDIHQVQNINNKNIIFGNESYILSKNN